MSIKIQINEDPDFSYQSEAEQYQILDSENNILKELKDCEIYELKETEKVIGWFDESLSYNEYHQECGNPLSEKEQAVIDKFKHDTLFDIYMNSIGEYIEENHLNFANDKVLYNDLIKIVKSLSYNVFELIDGKYKMKLCDIEKLDSKYHNILYNVFCTASFVQDVYDDNICYQTDSWELELKLGFIYSAKNIKEKVDSLTSKNKNNDECIYNEGGVVREIDGKLVKMKGRFCIVFMNLADALSIQMGDEICNIHCSQEVG